MADFVNEDGMPMGFGMALAQDNYAMSYFSGLSPEERRAIIAQTHNIRSKQEMKAFVSRLGR